MAHALVISPVESDRFGVTCARIQFGVEDDAGAIDRLNCASQTDQVGLVIVRLPVENIGLLHRLLSDGHLLMDTLVYYDRPVTGIESTPIVPSDLILRYADPTEAKAVGRIAEDAFADYISHYHADPRLDIEAVRAGYVDWAERTVAQSGDQAPVLVLTANDVPVSFMALRQREGDLEIALTATAPAFQRKGLFTVLMNAALFAGRERKMKRIIISTQINNYRAQKIWSVHGFSHFQAYYTFHKWYDR